MMSLQFSTELADQKKKDKVFLYSKWFNPHLGCVSQPNVSPKTDDNWQNNIKHLY